MDLYLETLSKFLENQKVEISFPNLEIDSTKIVQLECYKALNKIKAIIQDDSLEDSECFQKIEEIVCTLEDLGSTGGFRHDF